MPFPPSAPRAGRLAAALAPLALLCSAGAQAQTSSAATLPLWELGALGIGISQQAYPGASEQVNRALVLPYLIYRGPILRADRETAGIRAIKTERFELDVGISGTLGARSGELQARRGMQELGTLIEFGPRLRWNLGAGPLGATWRADLPLRGVFDFSDSVAYRGLALEPRLQATWRNDGGWTTTASLAAIVANQQLADTLYTVTPAQALPGRAAYAASQGLVAWRLQATANRSLGPDWRVFGFARMDSVSGAANEGSPLVQRSLGASAGVGLAWTWLRSSRSASD